MTATFSEAMTAASISGTTVLLTGPGTTAVPATVTYSAATRAATLTPTAALANLTVYTATVKSGASGVKDAAGNPLASDLVWTFTTVAGHDGADGEQRDAAECGDQRGAWRARSRRRSAKR